MTLSNQLKHESSPYLLQHKDNPVQWQAWSDEAFELAKTLDKPIFLSIGYATCHWCHVMEHESFEDTDVAKLMNDAFINIKVDREERPDIDHLYMTVCQLLTGAGGWPLTVIMTPDKRPFFAGTYFPKNSYPNRPGMLELIPALDEAWKTDRNKLLTSTQQIMAHLIQQNQPATPAALDPDIGSKAFKALTSTFDPKHGGFSAAPKFPTPHQLLFLLRYYQRTQTIEALNMATLTLDKLMQGGIYDHVGFGFHRYSTDETWQVPHFEKMLYDQAQLLQAYSLAYQLTQNPAYARVIDDIITYLNRDLRSDTGAYFCAEDADSEGEEGTFYVWSYTELLTHISEADRTFLCDVYDLNDEGNFHDEATQQKTGTNIFHQSASTSNLAKRLNLSEAELHKKRRDILARLQTVRSKRVRPGLDDKILSDWNGLAIAGLADAYQATGKNSYLEAAKNSASMIQTYLQPTPTTLLHRYRNGNAGIQATALDYHYFIYGLLRLYAVTHNPDYLQHAYGLQQHADSLFWDNKNPGYFLSTDNELLIKQQDSYDGALPAANAVAYHNLRFLSVALHNPTYHTRAQHLIEHKAADLNQYPKGYTFWLQSLELHLLGLPVLVCTHTLTAQQRTQLKAFPYILIQECNKHSFFTQVEGFKPFVSLNQCPTFYFCHNFMCEAATTDFTAVLASIKNVTD